MDGYEMVTLTSTPLRVVNIYSMSTGWFQLERLQRKDPSNDWITRIMRISPEEMEGLSELLNRMEVKDVD